MFIKAPGVPEHARRGGAGNICMKVLRLASLISESTNSSYFRCVRWMCQVWASGGDPGGVCRSAAAPAACPHPAVGGWGTDSRDAWGQLLTGTALDTSIYLPYMGPPGVSCSGHAKMSEGAAEVKELARKGGGIKPWVGGLHDFSWRWASWFYNYTPR